MAQVNTVSSKVFLFDEQSWLYCSNVTHKNGIWTGDVVNGSWYLHFDENTGILKACQGRNIKNPVTESKVKMTWACDKSEEVFGYNAVIADAEDRYREGEEANYVLTNKTKQYEDDGIPF